jgi:hypothetical protein
MKSLAKKKEKKKKSRARTLGFFLIGNGESWMVVEQGK